MKKCDFRFEGNRFVCDLLKNHKGDHRDKKGFAMFNPDQYATKVKEKKPE